MNRPPNRYLNTDDFNAPAFQRIRQGVEHVYAVEMRGRPHPAHAQDPIGTVIHWSREWEYPWAVLEMSNLPIVRQDDRVLDAGCGGSPLLPYLVKQYGIEAWGIDRDYFKWMDVDGRYAPHDYRCDLRNFWFPPQMIFDRPVHYLEGNMLYLQFRDEWFDRVFCISVLEHMTPLERGASIAELTRVLAPGGRLLITVDCDGDHIEHPMTPEEVVAAVGLPLCGDSDFTVPPPEKVHGEYNVLGLVFQKE